MQPASAFLISLCGPLAQVSALTWDANRTAVGPLAAPLKVNGGITNDSAAGITMVSDNNLVGSTTAVHHRLAVALPTSLAAAGKIFARLKVVVTNF